MYAGGRHYPRLIRRICVSPCRPRQSIRRFVSAPVDPFRQGFRREYARLGLYFWEMTPFDCFPIHSGISGSAEQPPSLPPTLLPHPRESPPKPRLGERGSLCHGDSMLYYDFWPQELPFSKYFHSDDSSNRHRPCPSHAPSH